jgi:hypothetical protein
MKRSILLSRSASRRLHSLVIGAAAALLSSFAGAQIPPPAPLELEAKISLGDIEGRVDHMAIDLRRRHLFVAELGNNSVGIVDLVERELIHRLGGLREPQGIGYVNSTDTLFIANAGDGSIRVFKAGDFVQVGTLALGQDADNVRVDTAHDRVIVGYGAGGLAVIDPVGPRLIGTIGLEAHPEGFRLDSSGRAFVNLPDARSISVVDIAAGKPIGTWSTGKFTGNFPMAIEEEAKRIVVIFRSPPVLTAFAAVDGEVVSKVATCADADDVFLDAKRRRIYVSCGEGYLDVFTADAEFRPVARIPTRPGARTSLFVPELDRLFLAVRASDVEPAAIWSFKPLP